MPVNRTPFSMIQKSSPSESFCVSAKTQVRRLRVESAAHHRIAAAVVSMTGRAVIRKVNPGIAKIFRGGCDGICQCPGD